MKVTIRDEQVLRAIRPEELIAYLRSRGFREHGVLGGNAALWRRPHDAEDVEILAPLDPTLGDFASRMLDALKTLEAVEKRSQLDILRDIATALADVVRIPATRAQEPVPELDLRGVVLRLDRPESATEGTVTILGLVEGHPRKVELRLAEPEYGLAVRAHADRLPVACVGDLRRRGHTFTLEHPRQFAVESPAD